MDGDLYLCDVFVPLQQVVGCGNLECIFSGWQIGVRCLQDTIADGCVPLSACEGVHPLFVDSFQLVAVIGTFSVLSENCQSQLLVVGYQRSIHCGIVFENRCIAYPRQCVRELGRVAHRFLGNDVDGAGNGRRAKQSRAAAALMEIMSEDGTMARLPELRKMADEWGLKLISIRDLIAYRLKQESLVEKGVEVDMPTEYGHFRLIPFRQKSNGLEHIAIIKGDIKEGEHAVLVISY